MFSCTSYWNKLNFCIGDQMSGISTTKPLKFMSNFSTSLHLELQYDQSSQPKISKIWPSTEKIIMKNLADETPSIMNEKLEVGYELIQKLVKFWWGNWFLASKRLNLHFDWNKYLLNFSIFNWSRSFESHYFSKLSENVRLVEI